MDTSNLAQLGFCQALLAHWCLFHRFVRTGSNVRKWIIKTCPQRTWEGKRKEGKKESIRQICSYFQRFELLAWPKTLKTRRINRVRAVSSQSRCYLWCTTTSEATTAWLLGFIEKHSGLLERLSELRSSPVVTMRPCPIWKSTSWTGHLRRCQAKHDTEMVWGSSSRNWLASETCPIRTSQEKHSELTPCYLVARRLWFRVKSLDCMVLTNLRDWKFVYKSNVRVSLTYLIMDDPKYIERIREDNIDALK